MRIEPLEPRRIRYPKGAYGWVDLRIVTEGHLQALDHATALTYLFLCTVANRDGISFWSRSRIARTLNLPQEAIDVALRTLSALDLIAATDRVVQVLPLPTRRDRDPAGVQAEMREPPSTPPSPPIQPPMVIQPQVSEDDIRAHEGQARAQIARFYGTREPSATVVRALANDLAQRARRIADERDSAERSQPKISHHAA